MELAGAFGDLGTLIPFVVGYITLNKMDPLGILVSFGIFKIFVGLYFRTPIPIQPMKAIGGMAISHAGTITHGMIWGSGIFTGLFWLLMGVTGAISWIEKITAKPVVRGIMLGLGLSFITEGLGMMKEQPFVALGAIVLAFFLFDNPRLPAMLALLSYGIALAFLQRPELIRELSHLSVRFRWPEISLGRITGKELLSGFLILGLPQAPLTLGNAIIGTVAENNAYFPDRKVTAKTISIDHGVMNLVSVCLGGVPMCHGAGGMAGHIRFGARTGGALVILGVMVLFTGLFLSDSVVLLF
jgi:predicted benzoate:H+ symporter BenE